MYLFKSTTKEYHTMINIRKSCLAIVDHRVTRDEEPSPTQHKNTNLPSQNPAGTNILMIDTI